MGGSGGITHFNRGSVRNAAGKKDLSWLESAVLLKEAGAWRIQLFHANGCLRSGTRLKPDVRRNNTRFRVALTL
jgi:hypothetical protein